MTLAEAVYGKEHVRNCHGGTYYKIRYLKSYDCETGKMLAYPNGLPGWDSYDLDTKLNKIHFIGHSMGAITVRTLQHLLKTGYFDEIVNRPKRNRGSLVASLTALSGV